MTDYHSKYWALSLTLKNASSSILNLSRSIANARVDLNPHQVHASLFALQSPLSKGVILADEVGLGKTIEAGLVIAQKWAEKKRKILLITPAFLRKQWENELKEKFFLPSEFPDSKNFQGFSFENDNIFICSYQFAADKDEWISKVAWDLVVIDEAHRLRNVYKSNNKQARAIFEALTDRPKLLLTATPLQNNLMELYGLVSIIDPYVFGDELSFKQQFVQEKDEIKRNRELKARLAPLVMRTLRKQVKEYIPFTNRIAITQKFDPSDDEQKLYEGVSSYLQKKSLLALPNGQRQLITLILRKLLASSSFAIAHTLKTLISRLEKQVGPDVLLDKEEKELLDTISQEWKEDLLPPPNSETKELQIKIREEILELRSYLTLAEKIKSNSKGEALLSALDKAFEQLEKLKAAKKAVIFTESKRTQSYLFDLLSTQGYKDHIVLINGSNNDPISKDIYEEWVRKQNTPQSRNSRAVNLKAAIVDAFRSEGTILLATEAAAEGINLQFCSLVVNYDLPWNPQRIEQRIGRCHRYGQKHDVVVVNFLNTRNAADQRVFELLDQKFHLFDGVFGASDEILGAIESGVDIEKRIAEVYQNCRTNEEIQKAFDSLQKELEEQIQANLQQTRENILDNFDEQVSSLLKVRQNEATASLNDREKWFLNLACHELGLSTNTTQPIFHQGLEYYLNWRVAEEKGGCFLREEDPLSKTLIEKATNRSLSLDHLEFDYSSHPGKISLLEPLIGNSGYLELSRLRINTFEAEEFLLFSALTDSNEPLDPETCHKLFQLPATIVNIDNSLKAPSFDTIREKLQNQSVKLVEERASSFYDQEVVKLDNWSEDLKLGLEKELKELEKDIRQARKTAALSKTFEEKLENQKKIKSLEATRTTKRKALFSEQDRIESKRDELINGLEKRLQPSTSLETVFTIRWSIK